MVKFRILVHSLFIELNPRSIADRWRIWVMRLFWQKFWQLILGDIMKLCFGRNFANLCWGKSWKSVLSALWGISIITSVLFLLASPEWFSRTISAAPAGPIWSFTCSHTNSAPAWSSSGTAPHSSYPALSKETPKSSQRNPKRITQKSKKSKGNPKKSGRNTKPGPHPAQRRIPHILHRAN